MPSLLFGESYQIVPTALANSLTGAAELRNRFRSVNVASTQAYYLPENHDSYQECYTVHTGPELPQVKDAQKLVDSTPEHEIDKLKNARKALTSLLSSLLQKAVKVQVDEVGSLTPVSIDSHGNVTALNMQQIPPELAKALQAPRQ